MDVGERRRAENMPAIGAAPEVREGQRVIARRSGRAAAKREKIRALGGGGRRVSARRVSVEKEIRPWVFGRLKLTGGPSTVIYAAPGSPDRPIESIEMRIFFFFRIGRVTAAPRNGRTRTRRKRSPADYVCSVTTSRGSSDKRSGNISCHLSRRI